MNGEMAWKHHELRLFGHRGAAARVPENTMESFDRALADGATALEMDVHLTRDHHLVVAHDPDGVRTAGRDQLIAETTFEDLGRWNVAQGFGFSSPRPIRIPELSEVIRAWPGVPICVDIKPQDPRIIRSILEIVRALDAEADVTVGSFHGEQIRQLRRMGYRGPTALTHSELAVARFLPGFLCTPAIRGQAAMIPTRHGSIGLDGKTFIRRCRRLGLRVDFWVVNDPATARSLLSAGATGIVTDDPGRLAHLLVELG